MGERIAVASATQQADAAGVVRLEERGGADRLPLQVLVEIDFDELQRVDSGDFEYRAATRAEDLAVEDETLRPKGDRLITNGALCGCHRTVEELRED